MDIISRKDAREQGLKYYFTGEPCNKGHISQRMINGSCQECRLEHNRERKYWTKEKTKETSSRYRRLNPQIQMLERARMRAKEKGLDFDITTEDIIIPELCPILGTPFIRGDRKPTPQSPSLDRIDPARGYVKGNVRVISHRANTIKNDASIEELEAVIRYIKESMQP